MKITESINVDELEGGTIWYSNVLEMTPELQNIKIETSQETKKNTNTKVKQAIIPSIWSIWD